MSAILNPDTGLANVLANFSDPKTDGRETLNGVDTVRVTGNVSADAVNKIAPQIAATGPVPGTAWIREDGNHELIQAKMDPTPGNSITMTMLRLGQAGDRHQTGRLMRASRGAARPATSGRRVAISAGSLAVLLGALDTYVVVTIMTDIMKDVGIGINQIQRATPIITWYLLGYIAAMPLLGRASDRFGRKMVLQVSLAGFAVGSVITALSNDLLPLIIGRAIQGTASGALLPVTLALAADLWSARNRASVLGGIGAAQELGSVLGPLYGIAVVWALNTWRDVFWINVPLAIVAMVMIHFSLPSRQKSETPEKVDVIGGVLLAIALGLATWGLYNPAPDGKQVLPSYGLPLLLGALVAAVAFFVWESFARHPADRTHRCALPAVPCGAGRLVGRRRGLDGDARQRRAVRPGRARSRQERGRRPAAAVSDRAADRRPAGRLDRDQDRRSDRGVRRAC